MGMYIKRNVACPTLLPREHGPQTAVSHEKMARQNIHMSCASNDAKTWHYTAAQGARSQILGKGCNFSCNLHGGLGRVAPAKSSSSRQRERLPRNTLQRLRLLLPPACAAGLGFSKSSSISCFFTARLLTKAVYTRSLSGSSMAS